MAGQWLLRRIGRNSELHLRQLCGIVRFESRRWRYLFLFHTSCSLQEIGFKVFTSTNKNPSHQERKGISRNNRGMEIALPGRFREGVLL